jgi:hypothetical protein
VRILHVLPGVMAGVQSRLGQQEGGGGRKKRVSEEKNGSGLALEEKNGSGLITVVSYVRGLQTVGYAVAARSGTLLRRHLVNRLFRLPHCRRPSIRGSPNRVAEHCWRSIRASPQREVDDRVRELVRVVDFRHEFELVDAIGRS